MACWLPALRATLTWTFAMLVCLLAGTAGGEAQQADIKQLLKELELKKAKLNELKGESRKNESAIAKIRDDDTDAQRLTPDDNVDENSYIQVSTVGRRHGGWAADDCTVWKPT